MVFVKRVRQSSTAYVKSGPSPSGRDERRTSVTLRVAVSCDPGVTPEYIENKLANRNSELSKEFGAGDVTRTRDLLITNQLLYQLSYAGQAGTDILARR